LTGYQDFSTGYQDFAGFTGCFFFFLPQTKIPFIPLLSCHPVLLFPQTKIPFILLLSCHPVLLFPQTKIPFIQSSSCYPVKNYPVIQSKHYPVNPVPSFFSLYILLSNLIIYDHRREKVNYIVKISRQADKTITKAPRAIQQKFALLIDDLERYGPISKDWPNFFLLELIFITAICHIHGWQYGKIKKGLFW